jgi:hypothetical protein
MEALDALPTDRMRRNVLAAIRDAGYNTDLALKYIQDARPTNTLADRVHEALCEDKLSPGLRYVTDTYGLRTTLRKARCFRLNKAASEYISDASLAIASDLNEARELARSPYPVAWIEIDNVARINRLKTRGIALTKRASGESEGGPVPLVGWLIERHPTQHSAHRASYFTELDEGVVYAPLSWCWDCEGRECPWDKWFMGSDAKQFIGNQDFMFGVHDAKCDAVWCCPGWTNIDSRQTIARELLMELQGELRHIFGLLVTLGHVPTEEREIVAVEGDMTKQPKMFKGKPILPLVHREVLINVPKRSSVTKIVGRVMEGMRKRLHGVRGHWRHFYNEDGSLRRKVWIRDHERGDETLGRIVHDYVVRA